MSDEIKPAEPLPPECKDAINTIAGWMQDLRQTWIEIDRDGGWIMHKREDRDE